MGFIHLGIKKIRITGGEPLVRKGIIDFFEMLKPHLSSDLEELTLTTNGTQLQKYANASGEKRSGGMRLGTCTNNVSEAHGLATALKICLHLHYLIKNKIVFG